MRELRYVGPGDDPDHALVELLDGSEQFTLPVAAVVHSVVHEITLRATQTDLLGAPAPTLASADATVADDADADATELPVEGEPMTPPPPPPSAAAPIVTLSPRDIQVRVRGGESAESLAAESGDDLVRIMRFAGPVLAERVRISDEARNGRARRNNADAQTVVFGTAVNERFTQHQVDLATVRWDAYRRGDGQWVVTANWADADGSGQQADWSFNLTTRTVTPLDEHAVELLSDRPIQPATPTGRRALSVAPEIVSLPERDDVFDQEAYADDHTGRGRRDDVADDIDEPRTATSPVPTPRPAKRAVRAVPTPRPEPELPLDPAEPAGPDDTDTAAIPEPAAPAGHASTDGVSDRDDVDATAEPEPASGVTNLGVAHRSSGSRSAKPKMPSWDDILMGVRRKTD